MTAYLLTVVAVVVLQLLRAAEAPAESGGEDGWPHRATAAQRGIDVACVAVLAAAPALRAWSIGTDTRMYVSMYNGAVDPASWRNSSGQSVVELGYTLWEFALKSLGLSARWFLAATAVVTNGLQYGAIRMIAPKMLPAISAYALSGLYLFQFNGMRQALAIAVFMFGMALILRGRRSGWAVLVVAVLIHRSAIIAVLAFALSRRPRSRTTFSTRLVLLCGGAVLALLLASAATSSFLTHLLGDKYGAYLGKDLGSGRGRLAHLVLMLAVIWFLHSTPIPGPLQCVSRFYSLGLGFQVVGLQLSVLDRGTLYFTAALPLLVPALVSHGSRARHLVLWVGIVTYYFVNLTQYGDLLPYAWSVP